MRCPGWGHYGIGAVLAIDLMIAPGASEVAQVSASAAVSQLAIGKPTDSGIPMAVLRGKVTFRGNAPAPQPLQMSSDSYCNPFVNMSEDVRISDGGLENVMVYVSSPVLDAPPPTGSAAMTLDQRNCRFEPHVLTLQAGQTLLVRNSDDTLDNVHSFVKVNSPFNIGQPVQMSSVHIFDKPEAPIIIRDDVHKWKSAYIGVFSHPYHAVSRAGGLYELRLPAGSYEVTAWHEKYGTTQQSVRVDPGENPALDFVFYEH